MTVASESARERTEHSVEVGEDVTLHVVELRPRDERPEPRALVMIPATLVTNVLFDAETEGEPGLSALERAADAGFHAYALSYQGYGKSSPSADGAAVTFDRCVAHVGRVVEWARKRTGVERVDLLGVSVGSDVAIALGGAASPIDQTHVGKLVLTAMVYRRFSQFVLDNAFTPALQAHLSSLPNGQMETAPEFYDLVLTKVAPPVRQWAARYLPGTYATGPTLAAFDLPMVNAGDGRAPALVFWGDRDPVTTKDDTDDLVREYGASIELEVISGGGHSPFLEPCRDEFWRRTFAFLS